MIQSFRPNKDTLLFNIKNIPLHLFNFIFIYLLFEKVCIFCDMLYIQILRFFNI